MEVQNVYALRELIAYVDIETECMISCGIGLISGVSGLSEKGFIAMINMGTGYDQLLKGQTYLFSDNKDGNGRKVAHYIKKHRLGTVVGSSWRKNPNSGKMIKLWHWHYNGKRISDKAAKRVR